MKTGITQIILGQASLDETLELCAAAGHQAVELVFNEDKDLNVGMGRDELLSVKTRCAAAGVEISSAIAWYADRGNLLSRDPHQRELCLKSLRRSLEISGALEAGAVLLHPGQLGAEGTYQQAWDDLRDALKDIASEAEKNKTLIGVENVWNKFLLSPYEASAFVDEVDSPWVGIYLDTANMMSYGHPEHWIRGLGRRIVRVHFKDFNRREHRFVNLGDGDTNWPVLMDELRRIGYDAPLIHEVGGDRDTLVDLGRRMRAIVDGKQVG
jgi:L-ribulose-5-phosphate 3-epimerase